MHQNCLNEVIILEFKQKLFGLFIPRDNFIFVFNWKQGKTFRQRFEQRLRQRGELVKIKVTMLIQSFFELFKPERRLTKLSQNGMEGFVVLVVEDRFSHKQGF